MEREPFVHAEISMAHVTQQKWGAQLLSWSPSLHSK